MKFNTINTFFKYRKHALFIYVYIFSVEIVYSLLYLNKSSVIHKVNEYHPTSSIGSFK